MYIKRNNSGTFEVDTAKIILQNIKIISNWKALASQGPIARRHRSPARHNTSPMRDGLQTVLKTGEHFLSNLPDKV